MRATKPSFTAHHVALIRAGLERPELPTGDAAAERRLYESLGRSPLSNWFSHQGDFAQRMGRRTAFFDRETLRAIDGDVHQIVIVGAGYDGRALRFTTPATRFFEVDHPATQADKRARLEALGPAAASCATFVPVDLITGDLAARLGEAGHDPARPTLFIVEGLLGYLPRPTTGELLATLRRLSTDDSRLAAAFPTVRPTPSVSQHWRHRSRRLVVAALGEPWLTRFEPAEVEDVFRSAGFKVAVDGGVPRHHQGHSGALVVAVPDTAEASAGPRSG